MNEQETIADIIAWLRKPREGENAYLTLWRDEIADRLEAAHKREIDALKQRCAELNAEVAAKDEVIKRLNDAIAEEQRRKMTTTEKLSAVGDCAKLREALVRFIDACKSLDQDLEEQIDGHYSLIPKYLDIMHDFRDRIKDAEAALAAPPRNCEKYTTVDEAMYDYADEALVEEWNALKAGKDRDVLAEELFAFTKWLFAPSTEKEGDNDADK